MLKPRQLERASFAPRMLKRVVESGHLNELDRPVEVAGEPELLKMSYVAEIPENRAHQRIVLNPEIVIGERRQ
jgi:hypothetical protein